MSDDPNDFSFDRLSRSLESAIEKGLEDLLANGELNELDSEYSATIKRAKTAVVMFYRTACPYCKRLQPILDDLADEFKSSVFFGAVNIDFNDEARERFNILGVPLVIAFKKGIPIGRIEGLRSAEEYHEWTNQIRRGIRPMVLDAGESSPV